MGTLTHQLAIVAFYAALNAGILFWLGLATGAARRRHKVLVGDGGVPALIRVMRGHANAAENIPMMFIMLALAAALGAPAAVLHAAGAVFTIGRALHAWHFIQEEAPLWQRAAGFGASALTMMVLAIGLFGHALVLLAAR